MSNSSYAQELTLFILNVIANILYYMMIVYLKSLIKFFVTRLLFNEMFSNFCLGTFDEQKIGALGRIVII